MTDGGRTVLLGDLAGPDGLIADGDWVESKDQDPAGDVRLIQLADVGDGRFLNKSSRFMRRDQAERLGCTFLRPGDVLISRMGDPLGRACVFPGDPRPCVTVVDVCIVRPSAQLCAPQWLQHAINDPATRDQIQSMASGTTRARVSRSRLASLPLDVPALDDQRRIVAHLDACFARTRRAKAALDDVPDLVDRLRQSILAAAFRGDLTADWREENPDVEPASELLKRIRDERRRRWEESELAKMVAKGKPPKDERWKAKYEEPEPVDEEGLPKLPEGWCWARLGELGQDPTCTVQTGPFGAQLHSSEFVPSGVPVIAVGNLTGTGFTTDGLYFVTPEKAAQLERYQVQRGDVLFARSGATLGKVCVAPEGVKDWLMTGHILRVRLLSDALLPQVLVYALAGMPAVVAQVQGGVRGMTRPGYNTGLLERIVVPLAPALEQQAIVRTVESALERAQGLADATGHASGAILQGERRILAAAFEETSSV